MARLEGKVDKVIQLSGNLHGLTLQGTRDDVIALEGRVDKIVPLSGIIGFSFSNQLLGDITYSGEVLQGEFGTPTLSGLAEFQKALQGAKDLQIAIEGEFGIGFADPWIMAKGKWQDWGRWFDTQTWKDIEI